MKRILFILLITLLFVGCQDEVTIENEQASVSFDLNGTKNESINNKSNANKNGVAKYGEYPKCSDEEAAYVIVTIDGEDIQLDMTAIEGQTQVYMTTVGTHVVEAISVYDAAGNLLYVAPDINSSVQLQYNLKPVPFKINLEAFTKNKISVDVVCQDDAEYRTYSWFWLDIHEYAIRKVCFFGNICTKFYEDFDQDQYDFAADFTVNIYKDGVLIESNDEKGEDNVTCIQYLDDLEVDEDFVVEIVLHTPTGDYVIYTSELEDDGANIAGDDGIFIFQVGNCGSGDALDYVAPAYLPIPDQLSFRLTGPLYQDGYVWFEAKDFAPSGSYAFAENEGSPTGAWCGDKNNSISLNTWYTADVYSSLELSTIPSAYSGIDWGAINWIINHSDGYTPQQIQKAIWHFTNGTAGNTLSSNAVSSYVPLPGEDAVVILDPIEGECQGTLQLFIITVDP